MFQEDTFSLSQKVHAHASGLVECKLLFVFFIFITSPGGVSKSTIFANHNLISVRHRKYRLIILLYLHVISCSSTLDLASSRDPEPRPSLESSNHSGLDLMLASIVESDLVFGYVSFSVSALNIQR